MSASGSFGPLVNCRMVNQASRLNDDPFSSSSYHSLFLKLPFFVDA